jgi:23S rRNA maturation mini-RNase III
MSSPSSPSSSSRTNPACVLFDEQKTADALDDCGLAMTLPSPVFDFDNPALWKFGPCKLKVKENLVSLPSMIKDAAISVVRVLSAARLLAPGDAVIDSSVPSLLFRAISMRVVVSKGALQGNELLEYPSELYPSTVSAFVGDSYLQLLVSERMYVLDQESITFDQVRKAKLANISLSNWFDRVFGDEQVIVARSNTSGLVERLAASETATKQKADFVEALVGALRMHGLHASARIVSSSVLGVRPDREDDDDDVVMSVRPSGSTELDVVD